MKQTNIGNCTLYLADCMDVLPIIGKVSHVITDPPYEKEAHSAMRRTNNSIKLNVNDIINFSAIDENTRNYIAQFCAKNCAGWALMFCQVEAVHLWRNALENFCAKYKRTMVWVKPDSSPQFNGQCPAQGYESIVSAWCGKTVSKWNGGGRRGVFTHNCNSNRFGGHPTEKPISLMDELISLFTNSLDIVFDPFMGIGTTAIACINSGRKFIGVERDSKYFDLACKRIELAYTQGNLFEPYPKKQIQESFL